MAKYWIVAFCISLLTGCSTPKYTLDGISLGESINSVHGLVACAKSPRDLGGYFLSCRKDSRGNKVELSVLSGSVREINVYGPRARDQFGVSVGDAETTVKEVRGHPLIVYPGGISYLDAPRVATFYGIYSDVHTVYTIKLFQYPLALDWVRFVDCMTHDEAHKCHV